MSFEPFTDTNCINVTIINDDQEEGDEVFMVEMVSLTRGGIADQSAVTVTIKDDDCELNNAFDTTPVLRNAVVLSRL